MKDGCKMDGWMDGCVNVSIFAPVGSAAVGELGTLLREKNNPRSVFKSFFLKKRKITIQDMTMRRGSSLPPAGWRAEVMARMKDQMWRNKSRDKLLLHLRRLSFFLLPKTKQN